MATSQALQRVLAHKRAINPPSKKQESTMEGIYLSKLQLKTLGENILNMANGPDGLCFMIGIGANSTKTVEVIPYKNVDNGAAPDSRIIFNDAIFTINAGGLEVTSDKDLIFDSNGHRKIPNGNPPQQANVVAGFAPITTGSQKTPPPFS
jgi:hypothetical protein